MNPFATLRDGNETTNPVQSRLRALDAIWPDDPGLRMATAGGITNDCEDRRGRCIDRQCQPTNILVSRDGIGDTRYERRDMRNGVGFLIGRRDTSTHGIPNR